MIDRLKSQARLGMEPVGHALARTGITPNALTIVGCLLNFGVAAVIASGSLALGGFLTLFAGAFDMLDGALARAAGKRALSAPSSTRRSTATRKRRSSWESWSGRAAARRAGAGAYLRRGDRLAHGELRSGAGGGSGAQEQRRVFQRPERILLLGVGLIFGLEVPALWILAILTNFTAIQRILHVRRLTQQ